MPSSEFLRGDGAGGSFRRDGNQDDSAQEFPSVHIHDAPPLGIGELPGTGREPGQHRAESWGICPYCDCSDPIWGRLTKRLPHGREIRTRARSHFEVVAKSNNGRHGRLETGIPDCLPDMVRGHAAIRNARCPGGVVVADATRSFCRQPRWGTVCEHCSVLRIFAEPLRHPCHGCVECCRISQRTWFLIHLKTYFRI